MGVWGLGFQKKKGRFYKRLPFKGTVGFYNRGPLRNRWASRKKNAVKGLGFGGFGVWGFGVWGLGGLGFRVWGLGFGVWGLEFEVCGLGFEVWGLGFRVWGLGFAVE